MYECWKQDPKSVHESWDSYFRNNGNRTSNLQSESDDITAYTTIVQVQNILTAYRRFGHFHASIDPLGSKRKPRTELDLSNFNFTQADLPRNIRIRSLARIGETVDENYTLADLLSNLKATYCGVVGIEFMHIPSVVQCDWIRNRVEKNVFTASDEDNDIFAQSNESRLEILEKLIEATQFEEFLQSKFSDKRFGCDGGESFITGVNTLVQIACSLGIEDIVIGMAHRGRLNILSNVLGKPYQTIFREFMIGTTSSDDASGDVKYHLGVSCDRSSKTADGKDATVHTVLVANPSHLEAVNPVVEGKVAAKQEEKGGDKSKVVSLLIHGDGSFAGQGIVYETITMSGLPKYTTGGTIHVIVNNQVSFTTDPIDARPTDYCTDVAIPNGAPIFHVNGDEPDAVNWAFKTYVQ